MGETRVRTTGRKSTWAKRLSAVACRSMGLAGSSRTDLPLSTLAKVVVPLPIVTGHCTHRENLSGFPMSASSPADHTIMRTSPVCLRRLNHRFSNPNQFCTDVAGTSSKLGIQGGIQCMYISQTCEHAPWVDVSAYRCR